MDEQPLRASLAPVPAPPPKRVFEIDLRERVLLALALGLGILAADLFLALSRGYAGLGVTLLVLAWEGVLLWYGGLSPRFKKPPSLLLTLAVLLLAADFALFSNRWLWTFNLLFLPALMAVQMWEFFGPAQFPWSRPMMLLERFLLLMEGLFGNLGAPLRALTGKREGTRRGVVYILLGLALACPILLVVLPLLASADSLFALLASDFLRFFAEHFGSLVGRLVLGLVAAPFLFSLLYALRRPAAPLQLGDPAPALEKLRLDGAVWVTLLGVLDGLYLLFTAVQSRALFGGAAYLEAMGVSAAGYARSGFFQLVFVSTINLAVVLAAVQLCQRKGKLWVAVRLLGTLMVALSALLLVSAAFRMTLYVGEYGLSFKRLLTYWGMAMLLVLFVAVLLKLWRRDFRFFKVLFTAAVAGWLLLNALNVDAVVANYNVELYRTGNTAVMDLPYLTAMSYDALPALERLDGSLDAYYAPQRQDRADYTLDDLIRDRRREAQTETQSWQTWNLSAYLAAIG